MDVISALPHAFPFLLVDRVLMLEPGEWVVGVKRIARTDPLLDDDGQLPPVLLAEAMAQLAGLGVSDVMEGSSRVGILTRIDRFRCRPPVCAGDALLIVARVVRRFGGSVRVRAVIRAGRQRRAAADLMLFFPPSTRPLP